MLGEAPLTDNWIRRIGTRAPNFRTYALLSAVVSRAMRSVALAVHEMLLRLYSEATSAVIG